MYGKELRCLNNKGKYGKVTNTEIKWSIISKSVMRIIFVEFIDQLIDDPIKRDSLSRDPMKQEVPYSQSWDQFRLQRDSYLLTHLAEIKLDIKMYRK